VRLCDVQKLNQNLLHFSSDQKAILKRALELVKVKGRVLYSTTSLNPIENEAVVMAMIKEAQGIYLPINLLKLFIR
jgi:multisite-specific tRNA:(cytosine-C5)-methyltransferase